MDLSFITGAASALSLAKDFGKTALAVRNFNEIAPIVSQLNDQILKAQEALFAHNTQLLAMQQEQFETAKKLREMEKALAERGRYSLVEIGDSVFVYRVNIAPRVGDVTDPVAPEPVHHLCQPCFDKGIKSVLQGDAVYGGGIWALVCRVCDSRYVLRHTVERTPIA